MRFDSLLAGEPMSEAKSLQSWPEIHERYAEKFGVDPGVDRKAFAQHQGATVTAGFFHAVTR